MERSTSDNHEIPLADEDTITIWIVGRMLLRGGSAVAACAESQEAARPIGGRPYLQVVTDLMMPGIEANG